MEKLNTNEQPLLSNYPKTIEVELHSRNTPKEEEKVLESAPSRPSAPDQAAKIQCAGCKIVLSYSKPCYCVKCPKCSTLTAVTAISKRVCKVCRRELIFPSNSLYVSCPCGHVFGNQFIDKKYLN